MASRFPRLSAAQLFEPAIQVCKILFEGRIPFDVLHIFPALQNPPLHINLPHIIILATLRHNIPCSCMPCSGYLKIHLHKRCLKLVELTSEADIHIAIYRACLPSFHHQTLSDACLRCMMCLLQCW